LSFPVIQEFENKYYCYYKDVNDSYMHE